MLVFSLQSSGHFQGYALLRGDKSDTVEALPEQGQSLRMHVQIQIIASRQVRQWHIDNSS